MLIYTVTALVISVLLNALLAYKLKKSPPKATEHALDAKQLLSDLLNGGAMVKVEVVDPTNIFLRSPH